MGDVFRVVAGGLLALISSYIGLLIKRGYAQKVDFFKGMAEFLREFRNEITLMKTPLTEFVPRYVEGRKGQAVDLIKEYVTELNSKGKFERDVEKWDYAHMSRGEKEEVLHLFQSLGKSDLNEQKVIVDNFEKAIQNRQNIAEENLKKKGATYFKLLVLLGIAIMVVLW